MNRLVTATSVLLALAISIPRVHAQEGDAAVPVSIPDGYWHGTLAAPGRVWELALDVRASRTEAVRLDVPSIWRIGLPLASFERREDSISFDLPWEIGKVRGRVDGDRIDGTARLSNGDVGVLRLRQDERIPTRIQDLVFRNGSVEIGASIFAPASPGPHPGVVVLHGGGDSSRESPPYRFWGPYLARRGYVVLLYDKRGNGASGGDWRGVGFEERADDVAAGIRELRRRADVDPSKVGLIAVSQGSWVAGLVARRDPELRFVINISGPAVSVREADTYALRSQLERDGWTARHVGERLALWQMTVDYTLSDGSEALWDRLVAAEAWARNRSWAEADGFELGDRDSWWKQWYGRVADYDPLPALRDIQVPMLWIYGERDSESDVTRNVSVLQQLALSSGKDHAIVVFPAAGHGLLGPVTDDGTDREPLTSAPGFFDSLLHWLERTVRRRGGGGIPGARGAGP